MIIKVHRSYIYESGVTYKDNPIKRACVKDLDLPDYCVETWSKVLILKDYSGNTVFSDKWPESVLDFLDRLDRYSSLGIGRAPGSFSFEIGVFEFFPGYKVDFLEEALKRINREFIYSDWNKND